MPIVGSSLEVIRAGSPIRKKEHHHEREEPTIERDAGYEKVELYDLHKDEDIYEAM